jgi:hypothetical protein
MKRAKKKKGVRKRERRLRFSTIWLERRKERKENDDFEDFSPKPTKFSSFQIGGEKSEKMTVSTKITKLPHLSHCFKLQEGHNNNLISVFLLFQTHMSKNKNILFPFTFI